GRAGDHAALRVHRRLPGRDRSACRRAVRLPGGDRARSGGRLPILAGRGDARRRPPGTGPGAREATAMGTGHGGPGRRRRAAGAQIGREIEVLVESEGREPGLLVGRSRDQAPEIDGAVFLRGDAAPGDLVRAVVTGADTYDLRGDVLLSDAVDTVAPAL